MVGTMVICKRCEVHFATCGEICQGCWDWLYGDRKIDPKRWAYAQQRLSTATAMLLGDESLEAQTLLHLLISTDVVGDELLDVLELAERYLKEVA